MGVRTELYVKDLKHRGVIEGLTVKDKSTGSMLCRYFGGLPYGLPNADAVRWRRARHLPKTYTYGTKDCPGRFTKGTGVCPQSIFEGFAPEADCLQCNVWVPASDPPEEGWPVFFFIHGGFLQFGSPNGARMFTLLGETDCQCIIVMPAYRLNLFGFLASKELLEDSDEGTVGNLGFWDQRLALEWAYQNISLFGGNSSNITVGGYSAGSHSAFHQLSYDLGLSDDKSIIRRTIMWSNGPGLQPKTLSECQVQFDELLAALDIPLSLSSTEKVRILRDLDPEELLAAATHVKHHQFRAVSDGSFVRRTLFSEIDTGIFAQTLCRRNMELVIGECSNEHFVYGLYRTPDDSMEAMFERFEADYPRAACEVLRKHYCPTGELPEGCKDWRDAFGRIYADVQIHSLERGFIDALVRHGAAERVHRYRIEWRAKCMDKIYPPAWGATHGSDQAIWFFGNGEELDELEKAIVGNFIKPMTNFLRGESMSWGTNGPHEVRRLCRDGTIDVWEDQQWDEGVRLWRELATVGCTGRAPTAAL